MRCASLACLAAVLVTAGCSHGAARGDTQRGAGALHGPTVSASTSRPTSGGSPRRTEFAIQADRICTRYVREAARLPVVLAPTPGQAIADARQFGSLVTRQAGDLGSLSPPPGEEDAVRAWLSRQRRLGRAIARGVPGAGGSEQASENLTAELRRESIALGLHTCFVVRLEPNGG